MRNGAQHIRSIKRFVGFLIFDAHLKISYYVGELLHRIYEETNLKMLA